MGPPKKKRDWGQRYIGFGPRIGPFHGFGAGVRAGHPYVGADISGGWQPIWVIIQKQYFGSSAASDIDFEGAHSGQLSVGAYVSFNPGKRFVAGLNAGYRYNSVLGHGFAVGFDGLLNLSKLLALNSTSALWCSSRATTNSKKKSVCRATSNSAFRGRPCRLVSASV